MKDIQDVGWLRQTPASLNFLPRLVQYPIRRTPQVCENMVELVGIELLVGSENTQVADSP